MNLGTSDDTPASSAPKDQLAPIGSSNSSILDDWENVAEELQLAQIAERQKEIVQRKQQQKFEEQQQKLPSSSSGIADTFPALNNPMNRPIRLLKRTEIAQSKNAGDDEKAKLLTFEERQAAYLQARERIFGQTSTSEAPVGDTSMQGSSATLTQTIETVQITNMPTSKKNKKKGTPTNNSGLKIEDLNESKANGSPSASQESPCQQDAGTGSGTTTPEDSPVNKEDVKNYLSDVQMVSIETAPISLSRKPKGRHIQQMGFAIPPPPVPIPPSFPSNLAMLVQQAMPLRYTSPPTQPQPLSKIQPGYPYRAESTPQTMESLSNREDLQAYQGMIHPGARPIYSSSDVMVSQPGYPYKLESTSQTMEPLSSREDMQAYQGMIHPGARPIYSSSNIMVSQPGYPYRAESTPYTMEPLSSREDMQAYHGMIRPGAHSIYSSSEVMVPRSSVGIIIGKGGETIKRLGAESGAKIQFKADDDPNSQERYAILQGTPEQINRATQLINELVIRNTPSATATDACHMHVPANKAGLVIGKGGETIRQICGETGAHVELSREPPPNPNEKVFVIKGTPYQIQHVQHIIRMRVGDIAPTTPFLSQNGNIFYR
ncbi:KH domain-containing protein [Ditylenchus destructor]|nr:KH domain-containing protein [Ditylenchus destructor]